MNRRAAFWRVALALLALSWFGFERSVSLTPRPAGRLLLDRQGQFIARLGDGAWPLAHLPPRLVAATLAAEDGRFRTHPGVDPLAVGRAVGQAARHGRIISGASTLAMQLARLDRPGPRSLPRKLAEAATALALTRRYGRDAILRAYLERAPYGGVLVGAAEASAIYFGKSAEALDWAEAAFLAALPQSPGLSNPARPMGLARARARAARIIDRLERDGTLAAAAAGAARARLAVLTPRRLPPRPEELLPALPRLTVATAGRSGEVRTTLDLAANQRAAQIARRHLADLNPFGAEQAAVIVARLPDRQVLALIGAADPAAAGSATDFTRTWRSPGSTLKPFLFALGLARGVVAADRAVADRPLPVALRNVDGAFLGDLLPAVALANSRNLPAAALVARLGEADVLGFLDRLRLVPPQRRAYGLGLAIGAMPSRLDRMTAAYALLGDEGRIAPLQLTLTAAAPEPAVPPAIARTLRDMLADPQARLPSFARMGGMEFPAAVAVKTGTSQGARDAWTFAVSRRHVVGVWIGRPDHGPMPGVSGANAAAPLAHEILLALEPDLRGGLSDHATSVALVDPAPAPAGFAISTPADGARFQINPAVPIELQQLRLTARAPAATDDILWAVDEVPLARMPADRPAYWPLKPGRHRITATRGREAAQVIIHVRAPQD